MTTNAVDYVKRSEGFRGGLYLDTEGYPTIGYGFRVGPKVDGFACGYCGDWEMSERVGEIFDGSGDWLPEPVAAYWLQHKLEQCVTRAMDDIDPEAWRAMTRTDMSSVRWSLAEEVGFASPRQAAVLDFIYHNGSMVNFPGLKAAIQGQDWYLAALHMMRVDCESPDLAHTAYYTKHTKRAERNMHILRTGEWPGEEMW